MAGLFFQMLDVRKQRATRSGRPQPSGMIVRAQPRVTKVLVGTHIGGRVNQDLAMIAPRLRAAMPVIGGVLIGVSLHEAREPDEDGVRAQTLVSVDILGEGRIPQLVLGIYQRTARPVRRAPKGWTSRIIYLWATV